MLFVLFEKNIYIIGAPYCNPTANLASIKLKSNTTSDLIYTKYIFDCVEQKQQYYETQTLGLLLIATNCRLKSVFP